MSEKLKRGPKPKLHSNTQMFFLRVSDTLKQKLTVLSPDESRFALESAAEKKMNISKNNA